MIRHAEAEGNLYRRVHGWYDSRITDRGFRQIAALEERFRDIPVDAVWSSDLYRTCATASAPPPPGWRSRTAACASRWRNRNSPAPPDRWPPSTTSRAACWPVRWCGNCSR